MKDLPASKMCGECCTIYNLPMTVKEYSKVLIFGGGDFSNYVLSHSHELLIGYGYCSDECMEKADLSDALPVIIENIEVV